MTMVVPSIRQVSRRSARALLLDDDGRLVLIKRTKPGESPYWTTPGGGIEPGESTTGALERELGEGP
ncbi:MAG: NUDIX domain-containing protein [Pseudonocardiaceae bacterium]